VGICSLCAGALALETPASHCSITILACRNVLNSLRRALPLFHCLDVKLRVFLCLTADFKFAAESGYGFFKNRVGSVDYPSSGHGRLLAGQTERAASTEFTSDSSPSDAFAPSPGTTRVAPNVAAGYVIHQVAAVYPPIAKTAHISGTVVLHAIIAKDGTIEQLKVVSGPPLLLKSAMDAVQQWVYRPTLANGDPVRVDTTISVVYTLEGKNPSNADGSGSASHVPGSSPELSPAPSQGAQEEAATQSPAGATPERNAATQKPKLKRVRVGGAVAAANLVHQVTPDYPKDAKKKHISGTVLLRATIGHDGTIESLEYVSGPPELTTSAMDAVKQWRYKPTLLNGDPVEVDTMISVVFTLGNH
jgi:TonB family protein